MGAADPRGTSKTFKVRFVVGSTVDFSFGSCVTLTLLMMYYATPC